MRMRVGVLAGIIGPAMLCFMLPAFGQLNVTAHYDGSYTDAWGVYAAGFYGETWTGSAVPWSGQTIKVVTDDYNDSINGGDSWQANVYNASSLTTATIGETLFGNTIGIQGYAEVAALVSAMYTIPSGNTTVALGTLGGLTATQGDVSAAIWYITGGPAWTSLSSAEQALVTYVQSLYGGSDPTAAASYLQGLKNLWISVPATYPGAQVPHETGEEDWYMSVPEGGTALLYLLVAGAFCFGGMVFSSRNQIGKHEAA